MSNNYSSYKLGLFLSFSSAFLWSTTFIAAKNLMKEQQIDPFSLSLIRFALGGIILFILGAVFLKDKIFAITVKDLLQLTFLSLTGIVGMSLFLFMGQKSTSAINTSIIMATAPVLTLFIGTFIGEKLLGNKIAGMIICLLGCALAINVITANGIQYHSDSLNGDLLVLLSAICWAIYSVFSVPIVKRLGGFAATTWAMLLGSVVLLIIELFLPQQSQLPDTAHGWSLVIYIAVFPTALAFFAWYEAMNKIELSLLNVMQYLSPIFTIILAMLLLGETINILNIGGIILVIIGIAITVVTPQRATAGWCRFKLRTCVILKVGK